MKTSIRIPYFAAIDPLALLFPDHIYVKIVEGLHPHEPLTVIINEVAARMSMEEKEFTLSRVKKMMEYTGMVEKAVAEQLNKKG